VRLPVLAAVAVFVVAEKLTTPSPVPVAPLAIESQLASAQAVHEHPAWVETVTAPVPPGAPKEKEETDSV